MKSLLLLIVLLPLFSSFNVLAQTSKKTSTKTSTLGGKLLGVDPKQQRQQKGINKSTNSSNRGTTTTNTLNTLATKAYQNKEYVKALTLFKRLANRGDAPSQFNVGILISRGEGAKQNFREASKWLKKSARRGFVPAMYLLGVYYYQGTGVARNINNALYWLEKSHRKKHKPAAKVLAILQLTSPYHPKLRKRPYNTLVKAMEKENDPIIQNLLANSKLYGIQSEQNYKIALDYFEKSGASSTALISDSYKNLGFMYDHGIGTDANEKKAIEYYKKAAMQGSGYSLEKIGGYYYDKYFAAPSSQASQEPLLLAITYFKVARDFGSYLSSVKLVALEKKVGEFIIEELVEDRYIAQKQEIMKNREKITSNNQ